MRKKQQAGKGGKLEGENETLMTKKELTGTEQTNRQAESMMKAVTFMNRRDSRKEVKRGAEKCDGNVKNMNSPLRKSTRGKRNGGDRSEQEINSGSGRILYRRSRKIREFRFINQFHIFQPNDRS